MNELLDMVKRVGLRIDAMALDLARDAGMVARSAQAFAGATREQATVVAKSAQAFADATRDQAVMVQRATPRVMRLAQAAAAVVARWRWLRLAQAARTGEPGLREEDHRDLARRVAAHAGELRGGIAKLGQLASCRPDLIGAVWANELRALQDEVPAVDPAAIRDRISSELGRPLDELFADFDDVPLAAASLAQVHAAKLHDGTSVVVKVQVPGIEDVIAADIAALRAVAGALGEIPGIDLQTLSSELARALTEELDYEEEAASLRAYKGTAVVPLPVADRTTRRVLTMTRIAGERLTTWLEQASPPARDRLLGELVAEIAAQVLARGQVHADPHPGNFLVTEDGRLALLDFGCVLTLSREDRAAYARLVVAIAGNNSKAAAVELAALGFQADDPDQLVDLTAALIATLRPGANTADIDWQAAMGAQLAQARQLGGLVIPRSFVLLGRVLASVAGLLATYKPRLELHPLIARHLAAAIS
jgi:ubiquinone biosynthesis protein